MSDKWHGHITTPQKNYNGGPQGAILDILEYLSQSNNNADFVSESERFKFIDNLTLLEIVNLLSIGLSSFLIRCETSGPI